MTSPIRSPLAEAIRACELAEEPGRALDALIAVAVFPALARLPAIGEGIWRGEDGARVRALNYSQSRTAASTLVPPGHWLEEHDGAFIVTGERGEWLAAHPIETLAVCLAALRARAAFME
ncbi:MULTISPECIES: hypothetical protein [unclassified Sphingomonas]|uniref:hypothetical protein n=1 Tax=unclassified Sphingomonas TaxID=196159 RepID=UPI00092A9280|nr:MULTISPECIES: hypothetical protein [unclassified Sphingomonas]MBN8847431.1 hypothetical protein [Sphingomonas sp.]OJV32347.1 MAG: hypothetical protein BGO24_16395 [Sphingomonas sp. 67-36]